LVHPLLVVITCGSGAWGILFLWWCLVRGSEGFGWFLGFLPTFDVLGAFYG
ncbi:4189_t:CDS:2, partial [Gigaspora rosea]